MTYRQPIPANSGKYRSARRAFMKKQGRVGRCAICGGQVDMSLSGRTANGPSVDHVVATSAGGSFFDMSNWQLSHRRCNSAKGRGETVGPAYRSGNPVPRSGYPVPGDPRFCWTRGVDGWMHINASHGEPDHWNCQWPGCRHGERT